MRNFGHFLDMIKNWTRLKNSIRNLEFKKDVIKCCNNLQNFDETPPSRIPAYATATVLA